MARKLVKEMEDHKVSRSGRVSVRNRYTIFLCPEDYDRLLPEEGPLLAKLERHLVKQVRAKGYDSSGDISVSMTVDYDLRLGYFGILAEREALGLAEQDLPSRPRPEEREELENVVPVRARRVAAGGAAVAAGRAEGVRRGRAEAPAPVRVPRSGAPRSEPVNSSTKIIGAADAADYGLARQTICISAGDQVQEFQQGRVIVGRARDVDFVIDSPDVSRRHAAFFWSNGDVVLEDLGSTNGTMVNGYPISSTIVGPGDVVVIGGFRLKVETR